MESKNNKSAIVNAVIIVVIFFFTTYFFAESFTTLHRNSFMFMSNINRSTQEIAEKTIGVKKGETKIFYSKEFHFTEGEDNNPFVYETAAAHYLPTIKLVRVFISNKDVGFNRIKYFFFKTEKGRYFVKVVKGEKMNWYLISIIPSDTPQPFIEKLRLKEVKDGKV